MLPISGKKELFAKIITIPITALLAAHYVFTQRFPWEQGYRFPLIPFGMVSLIMTIVWYANAKVFERLDKRIPFHRDPLRRIALQFLEGGFITIGLFAVVYGLLSWVVFGGIPTVSGFTTGMLVCLIIASLVNGIYVIAYLINTISFEKQQTPFVFCSCTIHCICTAKTGMRIKTAFSLIQHCEQMKNSPGSFF